MLNSTVVPVSPTPATVQAMQFFAEHQADEIMYAIQHPAYYRHTDDIHLALLGLVFAAIQEKQAA